MSLPTTSSVYSLVGADPPPGHKVFFWNIGLASISLFWNHPQQFGPEPKKSESFQAPVKDFSYTELSKTPPNNVWALVFYGQRAMGLWDITNGA